MSNKIIQQLRETLNDDAVVPIKEAVKRDGEYTKPYSIGYKIIDDAIKGGVRAGDLVIGTGLSGMGKTTFFQNISINLSNMGHKSIWFSYELLPDNFYAKIKEMGYNGDNLKLYTPKRMTSGNISWIQKKIKEGIEKYDTKFVFIDDLTYLSPMEKIKNSDQKRMIIENIIIELKRIAIEMEITIFLISHVKKVFGRAIEMQDLTESGAIYKLADIVLVVERYTEIVRIGSKRTEVLTEESGIRFLKNRLTGQLAKMNFHLENNRIVVENNVLNTDVENEQELMVVDEKEPIKMFGDES